MNISVTIILVMSAVIVTMIGIIYVLFRDKKAKKKEIDQLKNKLESANDNLCAMRDYIEKILAIKRDTQTTVEKIKEAKTDEEIINILADIISANNNRVQDYQG